MKRVSWLAILISIQGIVSVALADGWSSSTKASNLVVDGITGTRHNISVSYLDAANRLTMEIRRNDYNQVCVYCHTPHGANNSTGGLGMPLWNRTVNMGLNYELYNTPTTLGLAGEQNVTHPGPASLTCLSCHDGVTAIDSIINMPGSGMYMQAQEESVNTDFLATWSIRTYEHGSLADCTLCHNSPTDASPGDFNNFVIGGVLNSEATDIRLKFYLDSSVVDLRDDHPVGILYPTAFSSWADFSPMDIEVPGQLAFFDDGNGRADIYEIRVYDSGDGFEVECASCHDPHGVPDAANVEFIPSFLRVSNAGSALCLTCHIK